MGTVKPIGDLTRTWGEQPDAVTPRLERELAEQKQLEAGNLDYWDASVVRSNVEKLEKAIDASKANDVVCQAREAAESAQREQARTNAEAHRQALEASEKEQLRTAFMAANPSATAEQFEAAYPRLREDTQRRHMTETLGRARAAYQV